MFLISDVTVLMVENNMTKLMVLRDSHLQPWNPRFFSDKNEEKAANLPEVSVVEEEIILGKEFINEHGQKMVIGASKMVQDMIGLPFTVLETQSDYIKRLQSDNRELNFSNTQHIKERDVYINLNLWQRIKFVFMNKGARVEVHKKEGLYWCC